MTPSRRRLLGALLGASIPGAWAQATPSLRPRFLSAARSADGQHWLAGVNDAGEVSLRIKLPERGHAPVVSPDGQLAVVAARRPGAWAAVADVGDNRLVETIQASAGRHFYGHGQFSPDGRLLYTTENDFQNGRGLVVCRSTRTWEVLGEFDSGGIGPHELKWLDSHTLAVANGGILTHPSEPRRKLNLDSMRPNLALLDARSGAVILQVATGHAQAGIRHIDAGANGDLALAIQYEGPPTDDVPLLQAFRRNSGTLEPLPAPLAVQRRMRQYTASVCVDPRTNHALATCPRGHLVTFWDLGGKGYLGHRRIRDAGGVALDRSAREFVVSNGAGALFRFDSEAFDLRRAATVRFPDLRWDNHLTAPSA